MGSRRGKHEETWKQVERESRSLRRKGERRKLKNEPRRAAEIPASKTTPVEKAPDFSDCCIICVGSTGAGKSSTVGKCTGAMCKSGSGTERVTRHCEIHRSLTSDLEPVWVDTVGWDDAEIGDDQTFREILTFIDKYNITKVAAVIWNISPNVRRDAVLAGQARLIDMFLEGGRIWENVIIVAKQSLSPGVDCQGALEAARRFTDHQVLHTGYRFLSDPTISAQQREKFLCPDNRQLFNVKTDQEVAILMRELLSQVGPPVQVVFRSSQCLDCGLVGDPRLLPPFCHLEAHLVHREGVEQHHPGKIESFHPSGQSIQEHTGRLRKKWWANLLCGTWRKPRYSCCGRRQGKEGCKKKWACCRREWDEGVGQEGGCESRYTCCQASLSHCGAGCSPRYSCCGAAVNDPGCRKVCKKCGGDWATPANGCFRNNHTIGISRLILHYHYHRQQQKHCCPYHCSYVDKLIMHLLIIFASIVDHDNRYHEIIIVQLLLTNTSHTNRTCAPNIENAPFL